MFDTRLATVSAVALTLALAAPAQAQTTADPQLDQGAPAGGAEIDPAPLPEAGGATGGMTGEMTPGAGAGLDDGAGDPLADPTGAGTGVGTGLATDDGLQPEGGAGLATDDATGDDAATQAGVGQRLDSAALEERLSQLGTENVGAFQGAIVSAQAADGYPFVAIAGADDFAFAEGGAGELSGEDIRSAFEGGDFSNVRSETWEIVRGDFEQHAVLAVAADRALGTATVGGEDGQDLGGFRDALSQAGIENVEEVDARLFRASADDGRSLFVLIGPEGFQADGEIALSDDELRERMQEAGLSDVERIEDGVETARGEHGGNAVLAIAGSGFTPGVAAN